MWTTILLCLSLAAGLAGCEEGAEEGIIPGTDPAVDGEISGNTADGTGMVPEQKTGQQDEQDLADGSLNSGEKIDPVQGIGKENGSEAEKVLSLVDIQACSAELYPEGAAVPEDLRFSLPDQTDAPLSGIKAISTRKQFDGAGYGFQFGTSTALSEKGEVYFWGRPFGWDQEGIAFPQRIDGLPKIKQIAGLFVLDENGQVWFIQDLNKPEIVDGLSGVMDISEAGEDRLIAVTEDGGLWIWLSPIREYRKAQLLRMEQPKQAKAVFADFDKIYWLDQDNTLWRTAIGGGKIFGRSSQVPLPEDVQVEWVEVTIETDYVFTSDGEIIPIDLSPRDEYEIPEHTVDIVGTYDFRFYLKADGTVWGEGSGDRLLDGPTDHPIQIDGLENIIRLEMGSDHVLALHANGTVYSWGSNMYGQLGRYPHFFETFTSISKLPGIQFAHPSYDEIRFVHDGNVYRVNEQMAVEPVLMGEQVVSFRSDHFVRKDGSRLIVRENECLEFKAKTDAVRLVPDVDGWMAQLADGSLFALAFEQEKLAAKRMNFPGEAVPEVDQAFSYPLFTILAKDGKVYYTHRETEEAVNMVQIGGLPNIKEWSTTEYMFFDGNGRVIRALDYEGNAYRLSMKMQRDRESNEAIVEVEKQLLAENVEHLYGGLLELADGRIVETGMDFPYEERAVTPVDQRPNELPYPLDVQSIYSWYSWPIEGPTSYRHVLVGAEGKIMLNGDSPFYRYVREPGPVLVD